ncbi:hypothetical protein C8F04DRAFT_1086336 [Mycena alexandri]|uniref:Uncharacterized protein n=1 Tax=Mycena alexandri TaxID=1745969 RepID=A0AAD6T4M0_9AGAR|nr:hypothetical protein C8F04DRAFT_1086336 [Mycena alexandri]
MFTDSPSAGPSSSTNSSMLTELLSCADDHPKRGVTESESFSSSNLWFPVQNENVSSSWPPKIDFSGEPPPARDAMEGKSAPHLRRVGHTRSIPNRASRSNLLSVPATPTNLWQQVSGDAKHVLLTRELAVLDKCPHAPFDLSRIRPFASSSMEAEVVRHSAAACGSADRRPPPPSPTAPLHPNTSVSIYFKQPVLNAWEEAKQTSLDLWKAQRRGNPYLPLMVSLFNPLRAVMPPSYWKSVNTTTKPFDKVVWNIKKPLPSPALRTKLRSRKDCDVASESYSPKVFLTGKLRHHCRVCGRDSLLKRLLLVHYWAARDDALSLANAGDDDKMAVSFPESVFLRDRHDFDDFDDDPMDDPLVVERHPECYPLRLF